MTALSTFGPLPGRAPTPRDALALSAVVEEQHGLVTLQQCLASGLTDRAVRHRLSTGRWVCVRRGVYLTVPGREGWWLASAAALLAVGDHAAWSHRTAAHSYGLVRTPPPQVDLLVDAAIRLRPGTGIRLHRSRHADLRVDPLHWPWRTTVEETLLDLADVVTVDETLALLGRAFQRGLTTEHGVRTALAQRARHRRRAMLGDVLADVGDGAQSALEVRFVRDVERPHGLPRGRRQRPSWAGGLRLHDVAYEAQRLLVELDGRLGHEGEGRVDDGVRDRRSATSGWLTVRGVLAGRGRHAVRPGRGARGRAREPWVGRTGHAVWRAVPRPRALIVGRFCSAGVSNAPRSGRPVGAARRIPENRRYASREPATA